MATVGTPKKTHTEKLTITELIAQGKNLDTKINDLISSDNFNMVSYYMASTPFIGPRTAEEQEQKIKSDIQSLGDLIKRREAIGRARVRANATTKIMAPEFLSLDKIFAGQTPELEEITIAECIWRKDWYKKQLARISSYLADSMKQSINFKATVETKATALVKEQMAERFGKDSGYSQKAYDDAFATISEANRLVRIDPLSLIKNDSISVFSNMVLDYIARIDSILSAKNASTEVEFEW